jgi:hypothetical protein
MTWLPDTPPEGTTGWIWRRVKGEEPQPVWVKNGQPLYGRLYHGGPEVEWWSEPLPEPGEGPLYTQDALSAHEADG